MNIAIKCQDKRNSLTPCIHAKGVRCMDIMEPMEPCPFYKTIAQYKKERQKAEERLKELKYV